jgi:hypothetical protein
MELVASTAPGVQAAEAARARASPNSNKRAETGSLNMEKYYL